MCYVNSVLSDGILDMCGVDPVVPGVDESVCYVNSLLADGILDMCGVDTVWPGVDESVCYVNSLLADGILDMCGVDTVVSGVDEYVCGVSSIMTADELDVCGCDSLVSDGAGDSSGVQVADDVVACGDDTLLPDVFRVGEWLTVVGLGMAQPGLVDGLICAYDSLRPEPPPMHAMCLCRSLLAAACYNRDMANASASNSVCSTYHSWASRADTYLHYILYCIFILCILSPGRLIKKVGRDVMDREFVFICSFVFNYLYDLLYCA